MLNKLKHLAKDLLSVTWIRKSYEGVNRAVLEIVGSNKVLTHFAYFIFFVTFNREQYAVLRGRRDYYRNKKKPRRNHVELRRNVHRLEKGYIMQPRRHTYAADYIGETVEFYEVALNGTQGESTIETSELEWARDVLTLYFATVSDENPRIEAARAQFEQLNSASSNPTRTPVTHRDLPSVSVKYDDLLTLATRRHSVRWFEHKPVPLEMVEKALAVAEQAPSACNRLPYEYHVFTDLNEAAEITGIPFGTAGYSQNVPAVAVLVGDQANYFSPRDRHTIYVDSSLSAMQFLLALETQGLGSCIINWPDFEPLERKMQKRLKLKPTERVIMLIAFGYPTEEGMMPYSQKKETGNIARFGAS